MIIDKSSGNIYTCTEDGWKIKCDLKDIIGVTGPAGPTGAMGPTGVAINSGEICNIFSNAEELTEQTLEPDDKIIIFRGATGNQECKLFKINLSNVFINTSQI